MYIKTDKAPQAIGPYSQGIKKENFIFTSGQLPLVDGILQDDVKKATRASLNNCLEIIREAGGKIEDIVKVTVFVKDIDDFDTINEEYQDFFKDHKPTRSLIQVARIPKDALLEIEMIAIL